MQIIELENSAIGEDCGARVTINELRGTIYNSLQRFYPKVASLKVTHYTVVLSPMLLLYKSVLLNIISSLRNICPSEPSEGQGDQRLLRSKGVGHSRYYEVETSGSC